MSEFLIIGLTCPSKFEKNLYKLMNNTVFSKMMENIYNHILGITITKWKRQYSAILLHAKPNFQRRIVYDVFYSLYATIVCFFFLQTLNERPLTFTHRNAKEN
ncbi:hypothetical protein HZH66_006227 [Vespula vulgaris]|uniref:Uncharacterized protein n=1 Tax=Vespula vulgaris TaxID=7454 RepID=A0A834NB75_VESVU|nr:hypothetical protein HZH66_006227 [Vespula vulgaris]